MITTYYDRDKMIKAFGDKSSLALTIKAFGDKSYVVKYPVRLSALPLVYKSSACRFGTKLSALPLVYKNKMLVEKMACTGATPKGLNICRIDNLTTTIRPLRGRTTETLNFGYKYANPTGSIKNHRKSFNQKNHSSDKNKENNQI
jgi:hypothetical protein